MSDRLGIGGNAPPPFEAFSMALDDIYSEAGNFLDGAAIENQGQADAVGVILSSVKKIRKDADAARAEEKRPHMDAAKAVDTQWRPLLDRCDTIETAAKAPLTAYLNKLAERQREVERIAREEAARKAQEAIQAERESRGNLAAVEGVKALQRAADAAAKDAAKAGKVKPHVAGADRAIGMRTYWTGTITDRRELLKWIMHSDAAALSAFMDEYVRKAVADGTRWLPGVTIEQERRVA